MYHDVSRSYWWPGLKKDVIDVVARCLVCQQVMAEHMRPEGTLQLLPLPEWKWDCVTCDFVTGLPPTPRRFDTVWVIVDWLTKSAHFIPVRKTYSLTTLAGLYRDQIIRLHGVPRTFWTSL